MDSILSFAKEAVRSLVKYPVILVPDILFYLIIAAANALLLGSTGINSFLTSITKLEPLQAQQQVKEFFSERLASFTFATSTFLLLYVFLGVLALSMVLTIAYQIMQKKKPSLKGALFSGMNLINRLLVLRVILFIILVVCLWVIAVVSNALGKTPSIVPLIFILLFFIVILIGAAHLWFRLFFIYPKLVMAKSTLWHLIKETYGEGKSTVRLAIKATFCIAVVGVAISTVIQFLSTLLSPASSIVIVIDTVMKILLFAWSQLFTFSLYFSQKKEKAPKRA